MPILGTIASSFRSDVGAIFPLQVLTMSGSGASSVTFTNIPSTYAHLQVRAFVRSSVADTGGNLFMRYNGDSNANYSWHYLEGGSAGVNTSGSANQTALLCGRMNAGTANANSFGVAIIDIYNYANTNMFKTNRSLTGVDRVGAGLVRLDSGNWRNSAAITSITLYPSDSGNFVANSQIALYGVKSA